MSQGPIERTLGETPGSERRQNPLLLLILALTALLAWASGGSVSGGWAASEGPSQPAFSQADRLLPAGCAHITPVDAPDQDDLETLSEQVEDPLLAFGRHVIAFEAVGEAEQTAHGVVRGWAVHAPIFRSSSARGPPQS